MVLNEKYFETSMKKQIEKARNTFGEEVCGMVTSPCARHLHETRENVQQLDERHKERSHTVTAEILCIEKRARPDIETSISFLKTRVDKSNEDV